MSLSTTKALKRTMGQLLIKSFNKGGELAIHFKNRFVN
jgi:hypothetical protein